MSKRSSSKQSIVPLPGGLMPKKIHQSPYHALSTSSKMIGQGANACVYYPPLPCLMPKELDAEFNPPDHFVMRTGSLPPNVSQISKLRSRINTLPLRDREAFILPYPQVCTKYETKDIAPCPTLVSQQADQPNTKLVTYGTYLPLVLGEPAESYKFENDAALKTFLSSLWKAFLNLQRLSVIHSDLHLGNVLVTKTNQAIIIDWDDVAFLDEELEVWKANPSRQESSRSHDLKMLQRELMGWKVLQEKADMSDSWSHMYGSLVDIPTSPPPSFDTLEHFQSIIDALPT